MKHISAIIIALFLAVPSFAIEPVTLVGVVGTFIATTCISGGTTYTILGGSTRTKTKRMVNHKGNSVIHLDPKNPNTLHFLGNSYTNSDIKVEKKAETFEDNEHDCDRITINHYEQDNVENAVEDEITSRTGDGYRLVTKDNRNRNDIMLSFVKESTTMFSNTETYMVIRYITLNEKSYRLQVRIQVAGTEEERKMGKRAIFQGVKETLPNVFTKEITADGDCQFGEDCYN